MPNQRPIEPAPTIKTFIGGSYRLPLQKPFDRSVRVSVTYASSSALTAATAVHQDYSATGSSPTRYSVRFS
ncbi:hypothetical protein C482_17358 [Natrialba chahannaoensis JCM 10990]|uniref:Uncharacterized protein n=1 Tax=Natrialba chahannaoensis JCM 10990 TaxID=1227492 RepID=M0A7W4_9EURY|nr:hypothetical protein C482_17358 [Natrialba chahannaoensis JCM 10990]